MRSLASSRLWLPHPCAHWAWLSAAVFFCLCNFPDIPRENASPHSTEQSQTKTCHVLVEPEVMLLRAMGHAST